MNIVETDRLRLRWLADDDAEFIFALVNDPAWLQFIGDRNVHTPADARSYIANGPVKMYARVGFGLYLTELKAGGTPIGLCGLIQRDGLDDVDIGFALLPAFRRQGYAHEAAAAVMAYARDIVHLKRVVAIVSPENIASVTLLIKLGMQFERMMRLPGDAEDVQLFVLDM